MPDPTIPSKTDADLSWFQRVNENASVLRWIRILVWALVAWVATSFASATLLNLLDVRNPTRVLLLLGVPLVVFLVAAAFYYRRLGELTVKQPELPKASSIVQSRSKVADDRGVGFGLTVGFLVAMVGLIVGAVVDPIVDFPPVISVWVPLGVLALGWLIGMWAGKMLKEQTYELLMREGTPLPTTALRARAEALEVAMREVNAIAEDLRIEAERQQEILAELEKKRSTIELAAAIPQSQAEAIASVVYGKQETDYRRGLRAGAWINVAVGVLFYILGFLTDPDSMRADILDWFHQL